MKNKRMDHILNVTAIGTKMKKKPRGQRLYHFFIGVPKQLTKEEKDEIIQIIKDETKNKIAFLNTIPLCKKQNTV